MNKYFFDVLSSRIGFSRISKIILSKKRKLHVSTPHIIIPIKNSLIRQLNFIQEFENHEIFTVSKEIFLKIGFIKEKFKNTGFIFMNNGTLRKFQDILMKNTTSFSEDNIISIIPFNIPTTSISKEFAEKEIENYLIQAEQILQLYPNIPFGLSIKVFKYKELFKMYIPSIKNHKNIKILNLADLFDNLSNFRNILKIISEIKRELDNNLIIMVSGKITPKIYPILVYLGIDLVDITYLLYLSAENFYETIEYLIPIYKMKYLPCSCVACKGNLKNLIDKRYSPEKFDLLCLHNLITATNYMNKIKQYLTNEDFRGFVEKSSLDDMNVISILKILDKEYFNLIRYETPLSQKNKKIRCFGPSSYYRPDFQEFRLRTLENFEPNPWTRLIILLPCSARKPYSQSKSHQKFQKVLKKFPEFPTFQEFIITSPLGVIPRQLEDVYPVNSYDISVTGEWDNEEINITAGMLIKMLEKYDKNIPVICYLKEDYNKIVDVASAKLDHNIIITDVHGKTTSDDSLRSLAKIIEEFKDFYSVKGQFEKGDYISKSWNQKFIKILDYQFGPGSGRKIISRGVKHVRNRTQNQIILMDLKSKEKLGVFNSSTGQINLTITSLNKLIQSPATINRNFIVFDGDVMSGSTLFRAGVLDYSNDLIPNNGVVIFNKAKDEIIGTGKLLVGHNFIKNSRTGRIAKIIEKKKKL